MNGNALRGILESLERTASGQRHDVVGGQVCELPAKLGLPFSRLHVAASWLVRKSPTLP